MGGQSSAERGRRARLEEAQPDNAEDGGRGGGEASAGAMDLERDAPDELKEIFRILDYEVQPILDASGVPITREELQRLFAEWYAHREAAGELHGRAEEPGPAHPSRGGRATASFRWAMKALGFAILLIPLVLLPAYFFASTLVPPSSPGVASGVMALTPATPLIAPGQTQNYSLLTVSFPGNSHTGVSLSAISQPGMSFVLSRTYIPSQGTIKIVVSITAADSLAVGNHSVIVRETQGTAIRNETFEVQVVPALVVMKNAAYSPRELTVSAGTEVYWINLDSTLGCCDPGYHDVAMLGTGMNVTSPILQRLGVWKYTFETPGDVYYYCTIHPWMTGSVTVTAPPKR